MKTLLTCWFQCTNNLQRLGYTMNDTSMENISGCVIEAKSVQSQSLNCNNIKQILRSKIRLADHTTGFLLLRLASIYYTDHLIDKPDRVHTCVLYIYLCPDFLPSSLSTEIINSYLL